MAFSTESAVIVVVVAILFSLMLLMSYAQGLFFMPLRAISVIAFVRNRAATRKDGSLLIGSFAR